MNDDDIDHDEAEDRDEQVAAQLEVPPLDDLTRRRLVRRALAEAGPAVPARGARLLRIAAVVAGVAVVGGAAALLLRDGNGTGRETAERSAAPTEETRDQVAGAAAGDLGEVSDPGVLRERLDALAQPRAAPDAGEEPGGGDTESFDDEATGVVALPAACVDVLEQQNAGAPTLVATATYGGAPVFVVVAGADETAFVLDQSTCELRARVPPA
ncbi:MAG: hypothetical protein ACRDY4_13510 [Acidimicrobiia bacterium]